ncbi:hypothetical protein [Williamwhitmania taraxaci]|uniref:hypothetical protein n=1 Tax=Williamwhitmania taraxaci TaxID=1640674 RepID=UPI000F7AB6FA|nr:hypothetical protein [Williamwhitmania taraxaci]
MDRSSKQALSSKVVYPQPCQEDKAVAWACCSYGKQAKRGGLKPLQPDNASVLASNAASPGATTTRRNTSRTRTFRWRMLLQPDGTS